MTEDSEFPSQQPRDGTSALRSPKSHSRGERGAGPSWLILLALPLLQAWRLTSKDHRAPAFPARSKGRRTAGLGEFALHSRLGQGLQLRRTTASLGQALAPRALGALTAPHS